MTERLIVIGDIHAHTNILKLLEKVEISKDDLLIQVGDFLDRGSEHKEVLKILDELYRKYNMIILLGNHELFYLQDDYFHIIYNNRLSALKEFYYLEHGRKLRLKYYDSLGLISGMIKGDRYKTRLISIMVKWAKKYKRLVKKWVEEGRIRLAYSEFGYLFTHAGITDELLIRENWIGLSISEITDTINSLFFSTYKNMMFDHPIYNIVWTREAISDYFQQVIGHTPQEQINIQNKHIYVDNGLFVKEDQPYCERKYLKGKFEPDITIIHKNGRIETLRQGVLRKEGVEPFHAPRRHT